MLRAELHCYLGDERGSVTIEFVLWVPVIMVLIAIVIDATTIYITHAEMWNVARDTARRMSSALITCEAEAEQHAADSIGLRDGPYYIDALYDATHGSQVLIAIHVNDIAITGVGSLLYSRLSLSGGDMVARVIMRPDPRITFSCSG